MPKGKAVKVFGLGTGGVQLTTSPLALGDDELIRAQNAEPFRERGIAGIRKRQGLQRVVPTGSVAPSVAAGGVAGLISIDTGFGGVSAPNTPPLYAPLTLTTGLVSVDGGAFAAYTVPTGTTSPSPTSPLIGLQPNAKYKLTTTSPYEFIPLYPAVKWWNLVVFGGHESGQVLGFNGTTLVELTRVAATGSVDDTLVLPGFWVSDVDLVDFATSTYTERLWVVLAIIGGGIQLYAPDTGEVKKLPTLAATVTGSAQAGDGRLYVASGLSVYSIDPNDPTAAWTTAFTAADVGVSQLTGLAAYGAFLYAGTKTSTTPTTLRIYKLSTLNGVCTRIQSGGNDSLQLTQGLAPAYIFGPYPGRMYSVYKGSASATISGSQGGGGFVGGRSIINMDVGSTTWVLSQDIDALLSPSSSITPGPLSQGSPGDLGTGDIMYFVVRYNTTDYLIERLGPYNTVPNTWQTLSNTTVASEPIFPLFVG